MSRKIVAVEPTAVAPAHPDRMSYYVFCDDGTVWSWAPPEAFAGRSGSPWMQQGPPLPQPETPDAETY